MAVYFKAIIAFSVKVLVAQSCPTLCDPMDCSLLGFSVHGILQARILEWAAIPFSKVSSRPKDESQPFPIVGRFIDSLLSEPPGKPPIDSGKYLKRKTLKTMRVETLGLLNFGNQC